MVNRIPRLSEMAIVALESIGRVRDAWVRVQERGAKCTCGDFVALSGRLRARPSCCCVALTVWHGLTFPV
ncbi:hypothetical protein ACWD4P_09355 [Kitasatospora sp. NPDC002543]